MTIVVGFISKGGIAFGSDSQMTKAPAKALNSQKIFTIKFPCPGMTSHVLLAQSGDVDLGAIVIERMQKIADTTPFDKADVPLKTMRQAIREIKAELLEANLSTDAPTDEKEEFFLKKDTGFLLGYYFTGDKPTTFIPHLYSFDFSMGIEVKANGSVGLLGSGTDLAKFLMRSIDFKELGFAQASVAAIYVIEQVKEGDLYCSGLTQMSGIMKPIYKVQLPLVMELPRARIQDTVSQLAQREQNIRIAFTKEIDELISEVVRKQKST
jgi:hypothetical protein